MKNKEQREKIWRIELTEHQLRLIANCVEDCHRFIGGQMELSNSTACLKHYRELSEELDKLQPLVTPMLEHNAAYGWDGGTCPDKNQRNVRADQIVLIDKVTYDAKDNVWTNGKIYDPTNGKTYKVKLWFDGDKVLKMRGYIGPFFDTSEWKKID